MIRILLVDDHGLVRAGIKRLLEDAPDIEVVGEADTGERAVAKARETRPDVVLMDVTMPGIGGLEATRKLLRIDPDLKVIGVSVHVDGPFPARMLEVGASGYLTKGCELSEMVKAIRHVSRGERYVGADVAQQMVLGNLDGDRLPVEKLSPRELEVLLLISQGHKMQWIAEKLCLSPKTVSTYRTRLLKKLAVTTDVELTHLALRMGLIETRRTA